MSLPELPASSDPLSKEREHLPAALGRWTAAMVVIGATIGTGVFLKPAAVAQHTGGHVGLILLLWAVCGFVNLCGALTLAELAAMMPQAGGTYVYLRESYGRLWAFLWGWTELWVIRSGSIAALAAGMMFSVQYIVKVAFDHDLTRHESAACAVGAIVLLTLVNVIGVRWGGAVQNATTAMKIAFVGGLALLPFIAQLYGGPKLVPLLPWWPSEFGPATWIGIGAAIAAIMWAYDGWGNVGVIAEEIREPQKSIPWALIVGLLVLIGLYVSVNLAYHLTLPSSVIAAPGPPTAVQVAAVYSPAYGAALMNAVLLISVFGALNANVLAGPRVLFAMARDGTFFHSFASIQPQTKTPAVAVAALASWSCLLIILATYAPDVQRGMISASWLSSDYPPSEKALFDVLTDYCVFGGSVFYLSAVLGVFVLRWTKPDAERPYRTWGYPITPLIFIAFYVYFLYAMYETSRRESQLGLAFIALGVLFYPRRKSSPPAAPAEISADSSRA